MTTPALRRSLARLRRAAESYDAALAAAQALTLSAAEAELPGVRLSIDLDSTTAAIVWHGPAGRITLTCEGHVWRVASTSGGVHTGPTVRTALARLAAHGPAQRAAVEALVGVED